MGKSSPQGGDEAQWQGSPQCLKGPLKGVPGLVICSWEVAQERKPVRTPEGWLLRWTPPHRCPKFRCVGSFKGGFPGHSAEEAGEAEHEGEEAIRGVSG